MILQKPSVLWHEWWKFIGIPPQERRAAFEKLPPEKRSLILREHLRQVRHRHHGKLPYAESRALSDFSNAAVPAAFTDDTAASAKLRLAEEHMLKALSRPVLREVQELLPPQRQAQEERKQRSPFLG